MPKVLVLFYSGDANAAALADAIAEGATSVKFTEVEVRRIAGETPSTDAAKHEDGTTARDARAKKYRQLESVASLAQYDALIIGGPVRQGAIGEELQNLLTQAGSLGKGGALADKVGSAFVPASASDDGESDANIMALLLPMMHLGMILVPPGKAGAGELASAREQGVRVAKVAEWVRHAKSHEAHGHRH